MGQKINPHGLRVGVIKDWDSRWFAKDENFGDTLVNDYKVREFLKKTLYAAGIPKIEIERDPARVRVFIHCAKPGMVIGKGGSEIDKLRLAIEKIVGKPVALNVVEVRSPDFNSQLVAENIASQLERRITFRRAMKQAIARTMKLGAKGIKVAVSGRLNGAEIARREHYHEGTIPLQTLRADIDYGFAEAKTTYGRIGIKVWIYRGEVLQEVRRSSSRTIDAPRSDRPQRRDDRPPRRDGGYNRDGGGRPGGFNRDGQRPGGGYNNNGGQRPGGFNNGPRTGGFNNGGQRPGGFGGQRPGQAPAPANAGPRGNYTPRPKPAAPAPTPESSSEGGAE